MYPQIIIPAIAAIVFVLVTGNQSCAAPLTTADRNELFLQLVTTGTPADAAHMRAFGKARTTATYNTTKE